MEGFSTKTGKINPPSIVTEFVKIKVQLDKLLKFRELKPLAKKCTSLLASDAHNIPLFSTDYIQGIQQINTFNELTQKLSPFITWDNHSILNTIIQTSDIPDAAMLLSQFDDSIDLSQPLTRFPVTTPNHHMVPYDNSTHTILATKLGIELEHCTLQNLLDIRSLIQDKCKLTTYCLQLLAVANSAIIYWMIPKSITHLITANAVLFQNCFHCNGILQLAVYPGALFCTGSILKVGPLSFFNEIPVSSRQVRIIYLYLLNNKLTITFCTVSDKCKR